MGQSSHMLKSTSIDFNKQGHQMNRPNQTSFTEKRRERQLVHRDLLVGHFAMHITSLILIKTL